MGLQTQSSASPPTLASLQRHSSHRARDFQCRQKATIITCSLGVHKLVFYSQLTHSSHIFYTRIVILFMNERKRVTRFQISIQMIQYRQKYVDTKPSPPRVFLHRIVVFHVSVCRKHYSFPFSGDQRPKSCSSVMVLLCAKRAAS